MVLDTTVLGKSNEMDKPTPGQDARRPAEHTK
jgi:hypothetical protein